MKKLLTFLSSFIPAVLLVLSYIVPNNIDNLYLDYLMFLLKEFRIELFTILLLSILYYLFSKNKNLLKGNFYKLFIEKNLTKQDKFLVCIPFLLMIFVSVFFTYNLFYVYKERYQIYKKGVNEYFYEGFVIQGNDFEKEKKFGEALTVYKRLLKYFPNNIKNTEYKEKISKYKKYINDSIELNSRSKKIFEKNKYVTAESLWLVSNAILIFPYNELAVRNFLMQYKKMKEKLNRVEKLLVKCKTDNNVLLNNIDKTIFDILVQNKMSSNLCITFYKMGEKRFIDSLHDSWSLERINKVYESLDRKFIKY